MPAVHLIAPDAKADHTRPGPRRRGQLSSLAVLINGIYRWRVRRWLAEGGS